MAMTLTTNESASTRSLGLVMKLRTVGAQVLIAGIFGVSAIVFGVGAANSALGAPPPAPAPPAAPALPPGVGPWLGGGFVPYLPSPPIDFSGAGQGALQGGLGQVCENEGAHCE
jgi:hypothetical protein